MICPLLAHLHLTLHMKFISLSHGISMYGIMSVLKGFTFWSLEYSTWNSHLYYKIKQLKSINTDLKKLNTEYAARLERVKSVWFELQKYVEEWETLGAGADGRCVWNVDSWTPSTFFLPLTPLSLSWNSLAWLSWFASKPQESSCLHSPVLGSQAHATTSGLSPGFWVLSSGPYAHRNCSTGLPLLLVLEAVLLCS